LTLVLVSFVAVDSIVEFYFILFLF